MYGPCPTMDCIKIIRGWRPAYDFAGTSELTAMAGEQWKKIPGASNYQVSDKGRVRSLDKIIRKRNQWGTFKNQLRGRILKPSKTGPGYLRLRIRFDDGRVQSKRVAHLVLRTFFGPRPPGHESCHNNGDKLDNRLSNLRWDTSLGNTHDKYLHGTCSLPKSNSRLVRRKLKGMVVWDGFDCPHQARGN